MLSDDDGPAFDHERMDVYVAGLDFVSFAHSAIAQFPRGRASLIDQLERAATSVVLNTSEGCGEFSAKEKVRFYRMALRSAAECAAVLDVALRVGALNQERHGVGRSLLRRIVAMLTALVKAHAQ